MIENKSFEWSGQTISSFISMLQCYHFAIEVWVKSDCVKIQKMSEDWELITPIVTEFSSE